MSNEIRADGGVVRSDGAAEQRKRKRRKKKNMTLDDEDFDMLEDNNPDYQRPQVVPTLKPHCLQTHAYPATCTTQTPRCHLAHAVPCAVEFHMSLRSDSSQELARWREPWPAYTVHTRVRQGRQPFPPVPLGPAAVGGTVRRPRHANVAETTRRSGC
jgi:hypothetical protein